MRITPTGTIKLISSPFNKRTDSNKLKWITQSAQKEYFENYQGSTYASGSYTVISDNTIRVNAVYNSISSYNYLTFVDPSYYNKRFYCFITGIKEITSILCEVTFVIDLFQTFQYDGSKSKYMSKIPIGNYKNISPDTLTIKAGSTAQFNAIFCDDKHISTLANFYHAYDVGGINISIDGKLSVASSVESGTAYVVLAKDRYNETVTATANITITWGDKYVYCA